LILHKAGRGTIVKISLDATSATETNTVPLPNLQLQGCAMAPSSLEWIGVGVVPWFSDLPKFAAGDRVQILRLQPICHYRVPIYIRGAIGTVERVVVPSFVDNEEEGYGRNAGHRGFYYRIAIPMREMWPDYAGPSADNVQIEVFETWLERI
jgi:nitrile hydratase subunit beta